jgi:hypothetical protein
VSEGNHLVPHPRRPIEPADTELAKAKRMLSQVPARLHREWGSARGREFLAYVAKLQKNGVPLAWLADQLDIPVNALYQQLHRIRGAVLTEKDAS